jgi:Ca2+-binding RTX toxin-like protein
MARSIGTTDGDNLTGTADPDQMFGLSGDDTLFGLGNDDYLAGFEGNDDLFGGDQDDVLDGGPGNDDMSGDKGDDFYYFDSIGDTVKNESGGTDTIITSITLPNLTTNGLKNVENVILDGTQNINAIGNGLANNIQGNPGSNNLSGGANNDVLTGGLGQDTLNGGDGADTFTYIEIADSLPGPGQRDVINGFRTDLGNEIIDLSAIDADANAAGNQNFAPNLIVLTAGAAPGIGQVGFEQDVAAGITIVRANIDDGGSGIDFELQLTGVQNLTNGDFLF